MFILRTGKLIGAFSVVMATKERNDKICLNISRLSGQPIDKFDPQINYKHLVDCLKKLIYLYELNNYREDSRKEFETLYIIVTLESKTSDTINRALALRSEM